MSRKYADRIELDFLFYFKEKLLDSRQICKPVAMTQKWQLSLTVWRRGRRLRQENCLRKDCWDQGRVKMPVRGLGEEEIRGTKRNPEKCLAKHEYRCGKDRSHSSALGQGLRTQCAEPMRLALGGRPRGWFRVQLAEQSQAGPVLRSSSRAWKSRPMACAQ